MALISLWIPLPLVAPTSVASLKSQDQLHVLSSLPPPPSTSSSLTRCIIRPHSRQRALQIVRMAPEEEKMTRRSPLDFPIEWDRPKPGRRPDIFPQFSPMKTPLPPPLPADPPEEDEEEEEKKEEEEDPEKEEEPEKEEPIKPDV